MSVTGDSFACVLQSSTVGTWIVDSGASDHISGNKSLLSDISSSQSPPAITLAKGIQKKNKRGWKSQTHIFCHPRLCSLFLFLLLI